MHAYSYVSLVTLLTALVYFWMATQVARTRRKVGIYPPAMSGDPLLERTIRAHTNTLEWLPIFLPSLWLFAIYWNEPVAAAVGFVWIAGRVAYFLGHCSDPSKRTIGFFIQALAVAFLLFGALARVLYLIATTN